LRDDVRPAPRQTRHFHANLSERWLSEACDALAATGLAKSAGKHVIRDGSPKESSPQPWNANRQNGHWQMICAFGLIQGGRDAKDGG
jgi:hypothetical protein